MFLTRSSVILGDAVHPGLDGGAEAAPALGRLREAPDGRGGPAAEAQPRGGRHQRPRGAGQAGRPAQPALPR